MDQSKQSLYQPYPKQAEFHKAGANHRQRCLMAPNRCGKTWSGGMEFSYHLTGLYPDWWEGHRFDRPIKAWAAGQTNETTRDVPQLMLMGEPPDWGRGCIPAGCILRVQLGRGIADAIDTVLVRHKSGGQSTLQFKQYEQGRKKWEGANLDLVWYDEEPPADIYSEGFTRTQNRKGIVYVTFTPLLGMSNVVKLFYPHPKDENLRHITQMDIDDALHFSPEEQKDIIASYPLHEQIARGHGRPMRGSGLIFPVLEEEVLEAPFTVPDHFYQIGGLDFGWDHPTAAVLLVDDRDADVLHVVHEHRVSEQTPVIHAAAVRPWGKWLPFAWPHDGYQADKQSGIEMADSYRKEGVRMLREHATFPNGSWGLEAGLMEMLDRFKTGRLKISHSCPLVLEELRNYHRKDGMVVKEDEDLMCAIRYAMMMRRFARQRERKIFQVAQQGPYNPLDQKKRSGVEIGGYL